VNYYQRFIKAYSTIAAPIADFLKNRIGWKWSQEWQQLFDALEKTLTKEPVVTLLNLTKPLEFISMLLTLLFVESYCKMPIPLPFKARSLTTARVDTPTRKGDDHGSSLFSHIETPLA